MVVRCHALILEPGGQLLLRQKARVTIAPQATEKDQATLLRHSVIQPVAGLFISHQATQTALPSGGLYIRARGMYLVNPCIKLAHPDIILHVEKDLQPYINKPDATNPPAVGKYSQRGVN